MPNPLPVALHEEKAEERQSVYEHLKQRVQEELPKQAPAKGKAAPAARRGATVMEAMIKSAARSIGA
jgi:hypothetical protein